jgi:hypothetical protein
LFTPRATELLPVDRSRCQIQFPWPAAIVDALALLGRYLTASDNIIVAHAAGAFARIGDRLNPEDFSAASSRTL